MAHSKFILIVDDEESILKVLQNSIKKLGDEYQVVTASDGYKALDYLQERAFDLVITDYKMAGMNGLELLEAIRAIQPKARVIMMTAYGSDAIQSEARRLEAYQFLSKPLEIATFRQLVQDALSDFAISRPGILILSDQRYKQIIKLLEQLQEDISARCIFVSDATGQIIARIGNTNNLPIEEVTSLLGGGIATLTEAGRALDGDEDAINLAYREGKQDGLYALNIGKQLLLILIMDRGPFNSRLGSVWYYAQRTVKSLRIMMGEAEYATPQQMFDHNIDQELDAEFDRMFEFEDESTQPSLPKFARGNPPVQPTSVAPKPDSPRTVPLSQAAVPITKPNPASVKAQPIVNKHQPTPSQANDEESTHLLSFEEAAAAGLISSGENDLPRTNHK